MRKRVSILLAVLFFLGFPMLGLVFVWKYAHDNIQKSADQVAERVVTEVLKKWDEKTLDEFGTLDLRSSGAIKTFAAQKARLGDFVALQDWKLVKSSVGERSEAVWQDVRYSAVVDCRKADANLNVVFARRTMNPEWRIEEFKLTPR